MADQKFYSPGDAPIQESFQKELESERKLLEGAFQEIWDDSREVKSMSADGAIGSDAFLILADSSAATITLELPDPATLKKGRKFLVKRISTANDVVLSRPAGASWTIEGGASYTMAAATGKKAVLVMSDGSSYHLVASFTG